jgi:hypothetical protein
MSLTAARNSRPGKHLSVLLLARLSVLLLAWRDCDSTKFGWAGRLAEAKSFSASHPAQLRLSSGDAQATFNLFYGTEFLRTK